MAKPISTIEKATVNQAEEQMESLAEIVSLIVRNKESITIMLEIIQELYNAGLLDLLKGLLRTRDKVGVLLIEQLNQPGMHKTIKNGIQTVQLLGKIDPDQLNTLLDAANYGLEQTASRKQKLSKWGLVKSVNDPNVIASLSTMISFLQGMGKQLNTQKPLH